ncbi:F0F1 ATP synthase subunit gamma [Falsarthrobacter nasiphocae]|uniref:ATP synthase gamma chain n=1 Tax=Falsarthrobacter nasiphocae TaxID=189863 RepID=A0AAE4C7R0_9MICC|nr:F0F1 ATP synthase subunit gamma [Falsarthrobacter nasiphocae]MDR6892779.1 F-type H+-transporting ATPase subunit gamma [Falsarthrobacter nasiphocae]
MGAQIRVYREKIKSTQSMAKIFKAMELIATSRIGKARQRVSAAGPYADAISRAVAAVSAQADIDHTLTTQRAVVKRSAVLIMTSDRGLAGSYSSSVLKEAEALIEQLQAAGQDVDVYLYGRKGQAYFDFRQMPYKAFWTGNTDAPVHETAVEIGEALLEQFVKGSENGGVDDVHLVYTRFDSMVVQEPTSGMLLPLTKDEVDAEAKAAGPLPLYEFEPDAYSVLDELMPRYIESKVFSAMLLAAASELAARQRAMKAAGDNAGELIKKFTRLRNNARQAEITQELSEIVAGADALSA